MWLHENEVERFSSADTELFPEDGFAGLWHQSVSDAVKIPG